MNEDEVRTLVDEVQALFRRGAFRRLIEQVDEAWPDLAAMPGSRDIADLCRVAMLAHYSLADEEGPGRYMDGWLWRARALVRAADAGWMAGVLALVQTEALRMQSVGNEGRAPSDAGYRMVPQALAVLEELEPWVDPDDAGPDPEQPSPRVLGRLLYEKRGFLRYVGRELDAALADYERARHFAGLDVRGAIKVDGGRALVLARMGRLDEAKHVLADVIERADDAGLDALAGLTRRNLTKLESGRIDLDVFETL